MSIGCFESGWRWHYTWGWLSKQDLGTSCTMPLLPTRMLVLIHRWSRLWCRIARLSPHSMTPTPTSASSNAGNVGNVGFRQFCQVFDKIVTRFAHFDDRYSHYLPSISTLFRLIFYQMRVFCCNIVDTDIIATMSVSASCNAGFTASNNYYATYCRPLYTQRLLYSGVLSC